MGGEYGPPLVFPPLSPCPEIRFLGPRRFRPFYFFMHLSVIRWMIYFYSFFFNFVLCKFSSSRKNWLCWVGNCRYSSEGDLRMKVFWLQVKKGRSLYHLFLFISSYCKLYNTDSSCTCCRWHKRHWFFVFSKDIWQKENHFRCSDSMYLLWNKKPWFWSLVVTSRRIIHADCKFDACLKCFDS